MKIFSFILALTACFYLGATEENLDELTPIMIPSELEQMDCTIEQLEMWESTHQALCRTLPCKCPPKKGVELAKCPPKKGVELDKCPPGGCPPEKGVELAKCPPKKVVELAKCPNCPPKDETFRTLPC